MQRRALAWTQSGSAVLAHSHKAARRITCTWRARLVVGRDGGSFLESRPGSIRESAEELQQSQQQTVELAVRVDISRYREATLYVRIHSGTSYAGGGGTPGAMNLLVMADGHTDEDPAAISGNQPAFLVQLSSTDIKNVAANAMAVIAVPANAGALISILLSFQQNKTPLTTATVVISADLSLKE